MAFRKRVERINAMFCDECGSSKVIASGLCKPCFFEVAGWNDEFEDDYEQTHNKNLLRDFYANWVGWEL